MIETDPGDFPFFNKIKNRRNIPVIMLINGEAQAHLDARLLAVAIPS
jgi:hypothetical protein